MQAARKVIICMAPGKVNTRLLLQCRQWQGGLGSFSLLGEVSLPRRRRLVLSGLGKVFFHDNNVYEVTACGLEYARRCAKSLNGSSHLMLISDVDAIMMWASLWSPFTDEHVEGRGVKELRLVHAKPGFESRLSYPRACSLGFLH